MLTPDQIHHGAAALLAARTDRLRIKGLTHTPTTVAEGYAIQHAGHELAGDPMGPWKVGATSIEAQRILGVDGPFIGRPAADRLIQSGASVELEKWFLATPGIEVEIGLIPKNDLTTLPEDPMELAGLVDVVACIELVDSRFTDMRSAGVASLIADNAVASAIVVGSSVDVDPTQLDSAAVTLSMNGESVAVGDGSMALGHPLNVLHFAAGLALSQGNLLRAGELVITGTCTGLVYPEARTRIEGRVGNSVVSVMIE